MSAQPLTADLRIHITHCQGVSIDEVWVWPAEREQVNLQEVLVPWVDGPEPWLDEAEKVVLRQEGDAAWSLWQNSELLVCSRNGQLMLAGETVLLQHDDALELGMCALRIKTEPESPPREATPLVPGFDWHQLVDRHVSSRLEWVQGAVADDAVLHLLHDAMDDSKLENARVPGLSDVVEPITQVPPAVLEPIDQTDEDQALQGLHVQYLKKLKDPLAQAQLPIWQAMAVRQTGLSNDPFQDILDQAEKGPTMPQLLGQSAQIQSVLSQLDTLATSDILTPDKHANVMRLFAPEGLRDEPVYRVPSLNRQEHHGMALDSAMQGASARQGEKDLTTQDWKPHD